MEAIQFVGLNELEKIDQNMVNTLATEYYDKLQRVIKNEMSLKIHIKSYGKGGAREKYSIHIQLRAPTHSIESTKSADFDLASAMHKAFKDLEAQLGHHFRGAERGYKKEYE